MRNAAGFFNRCRIVALITVIAGTALLMLIGKQHVIVIENRPYEAGGERLESFETVVVKLGDGDEIEIYSDDFDSVETVGPFYELNLEIPADGGRSIHVSKKFYLGYTGRITVNAPLLARDNSSGGSAP